MDIQANYELKREKKILSYIEKAESVLAKKIIAIPDLESILHKMPSKVFYSTAKVQKGLHMPAVCGYGINVRKGITPRMSLKLDRSHKRDFLLKPVLMEKSLNNMRESERQAVRLKDENAKSGMVAEIHPFGLILNNEEGILSEHFSLRQVIKGVAEDVLEEYLRLPAIEKEAKEILEKEEVKVGRLQKLKELTAKKGSALTKDEIKAVKRYDLACVIGKVYLDKLKNIDAFEVVQTDEMEYPLILSNCGGALRRANKRDCYAVFKVKFLKLAENKKICNSLHRAVHRAVLENTK